jgi:molecular chaperone DnaK
VIPVPGDWRLSIDLGTRFTAAAVAGDNGIENLTFGGSTLLPSVVALAPGGTVLTGREALDFGWVNPSSSLLSPKLSVGPGAKVRLNGVTALVADLVAAVLNRAYAEAVRCHAADVPTDVTVCHPAAWTDPELAEIAAAAQIPGLTFLPEPVAAARHHLGPCPAAGCAQDRKADLGGDGNLVVVDFGAALDIAVIRVEGDRLTVGSLGGDPELGGDELDERLLDVLADRAYAADAAAWDALAHGPGTAWMSDLAVLRRHVTQGREDLSRLLYADIDVPGYRTAFRVTRREFEAAARQVLEPVAELAETAIAMAGLAGAEFTLALAGSVSATPAVSDVLAARFGVLPAAGADPKTTVAHGALLPGSAHHGGGRRYHIPTVFDPDGDAWLNA